MLEHSLILSKAFRAPKVAHQFCFSIRIRSRILLRRTGSANLPMKTRFLLATLLIGLISFSAGTILSFVSSYFVVQPEAKFTGAAGFQLGVFAAAWMSVCLMLSFAMTIPFYLRIFGNRSLRHLLIYSGIFVVLVGIALRSPPMSAIMYFSGRIVHAITQSDIATLLVLPMQASLIATFVICGAIYLARNLLRRNTASA